MALAGNVAYFSVPDIIMFLSNKNQAQSKQIWLEKNKELKLNCIEFKFPYLPHQPVTPLPDALRLVASIFCSAKRRAHLTAILNQHRDPTDNIDPEVEANAISESPVNLCALASDGLQIEETRKRKREEFENRKADADLCCSIIEKYASVMDKFASIIDTYTALCSNPDIDDQAKNIFKQMLHLRTA